MGRFRYRLFQFMQGRRGPDQFTQFLFMIAGILLLITMFWRNTVLYTLGIAFFIYGMFRFLSRNIYKREQENNWFLAKKYKVTGGRAFGGGYSKGAGFGGYAGSNYNGAAPRYDMQNYVYFKCPSCGQKLRAPRGKGRIKIRCSRCGEAFNKKV